VQKTWGCVAILVPHMAYEYDEVFPHASSMSVTIAKCVTIEMYEAWMLECMTAHQVPSVSSRLNTYQ